MWSGPRNLSTAMMRSFGNRADTAVSDEPFYGAFLKTTGADHPMREAVIAAMDCDWRSVARALAGPAPEGRPVWYQKHMWHHMVGPIGHDGFRGLHPRLPDPRPCQMIASYLRKREAAAFEDFGLDRQARVLRARGGPARPRAAGGRRERRARRSARHALGALRPRSASPSIRPCCPGRPAAARPTVPGRRTGTRRSRPVPASARPTAPPRFPDEARRLADRCRPYYERLAAHRIRPQ